MSFKFPFTNYHELNLTWVLEQLKQLFTQSAANVAVIENYDGRLTAVETELPTVADTAQNAAQTAAAASTVAQTAQATANAAQENAIQAQSIAGYARQEAQQAQTAADAASQAAQQAQATAQNFDGRIVQAENNSSAALEASRSFENRVQAAITTANNAAQTATNAQGIAMRADQNAALALDEIGDLSELKTVTKQNLVGALNEMEDEVDDLSHQLSEVEELINNAKIKITDWIENTYIKDNGQISSYNGWKASDFIEVPDAKLLTITSSVNNGGNYDSFYDENKTPIANFRLYEGINYYAIPSGAKYFRVSAVNSAIITINWFVDSYIKNLKLGTDRVFDNLFDPNDSDLQLNGYITANETWTNNKAYFETGYIPVKPFQKLNASCWRGGTSSLTMALYDSEKTYIGNTTTAYKVPYTVPDGVYYIRLAVYTQLLDTLYIYVDKVEMAKTGSHWSDRKWYAYGTSLTSVYAGKYVPYVASFSGLIVTNKGIPGGGICADTRVREAVMNVTDGKLEADLITVEVGANESTATLGNIQDTGNDTFCGCLNQVIRYLQQYTNAQIVIMSSTPHRYEPNDPTSLRYPNYQYPGGYTKIEMNNAIEQICKLNGVYYIPMGDGIGMGFARIAYNDLYLVDQIHHTDLGGYNIAQGVWSYLKNIPLWYTEIPS